MDSGGADGASSEDRNASYIDCSAPKGPEDGRGDPDAEKDPSRMADSDLNEDLGVVAEDLEIDPAVLKCIIEAINMLNQRLREGTPDTAAVCGEGFTATAYSATPLAEPLHGGLVSHSVIYNSKIRGRSGSLIFFTSDFLYAVKIIRKSEFATVRRHMGSFSRYYEENENTLLVRYYGVYELRMPGRDLVCFVLMKNVFDGFYEEIYDLKGAFVKRTNRSGILTEQDWINCRLPVGNKERLIEQINKDSQFLCSLNLMDYSMVIGLRPVASHADFKMASSGRRKEVRILRPVREFSIGIVDTLTEFDASKWMEWLYYVCCCRGNMSAIRPPHYRRRFMRLVTTECFVNLDGEERQPSE